MGDEFEHRWFWESNSTYTKEELIEVNRMQAVNITAENPNGVYSYYLTTDKKQQK